MCRPQQAASDPAPAGILSECVCIFSPHSFTTSCCQLLLITSPFIPHFILYFLPPVRICSHSAVFLNPFLPGAFPIFTSLDILLTSSSSIRPPDFSLDHHHSSHLLSLILCSSSSCFPLTLTWLSVSLLTPKFYISTFTVCMVYTYILDNCFYVTYISLSPNTCWLMILK